MDKSDKSIYNNPIIKVIERKIYLMSNNFSVAINYHDILGYIEYDGEKKEAVVTLPDEKGKALVEKYIHENHKIKIPHNTLLDFSEEEIDPLVDVKSFQLALTRLWEDTEVHVDWSRPVEFVKKYPTLESLPKGGVPFELHEEL